MLIKYIEFIFHYAHLCRKIKFFRSEAVKKPRELGSFLRGDKNEMAEMGITWEEFRWLAQEISE